MNLIDGTLKSIKKSFEGFQGENKRVFSTSSFQTQSVPLLHMISQISPGLPIIFLDTGFLFPETYIFKNKLEQLFGLNIIILKSSKDLIHQKDSTSGFFQHALNPDKCCFLNKVEPLDKYRKPGDVWVSGVRRDQTSVRNQMSIIEKEDNDSIKFHPMLNWTNKDIYEYISNNNLPKYPLENEGYRSIGCEPCTHKIVVGENRGGRWKGSKKTECGLHLKNK